MRKVLDEKIRYFEVEVREVVDKLRSYFSSREDVVIAILFGSALRRRLVRDIDVAVYLARQSLGDVLRIGYELEELLKVPVDLVPLDRMPPYARLEALARGLPLVIRDSALFTELLKMTISEIEDLEALQRLAWPYLSEHPST